MASKKTPERNCKQVIYLAYHLLPGKIWYKRYDQYSDLKQSKKMQWSSNFGSHQASSDLLHKHSSYHVAPQASPIPCCHPSNIQVPLPFTSGSHWGTTLVYQ